MDVESLLGDSNAINTIPSVVVGIIFLIVYAICVLLSLFLFDDPRSNSIMYFVCHILCVFLVAAVLIASVYGIYLLGKSKYSILAWIIMVVIIVVIFFYWRKIY